MILWDFSAETPEYTSDLPTEPLQRTESARRVRSTSLACPTTLPCVKAVEAILGPENNKTPAD